MKRRSSARVCTRCSQSRAYVSLIPVAITPSVRTTLVHLGTSVISPFRVHARAVIIGVAPVVVALPVRRSADIDSETRSLKVNSLRQGRRRADAPARNLQLHYTGVVTRDFPPECASIETGSKSTIVSCLATTSRRRPPSRTLKVRLAPRRLDGLSRSCCSGLSRLGVSNEGWTKRQQ